MQIHISKPNKAVAIKPFTEKLKNLFPEAKLLDGWGIIKHGLAETILLRQLGHRIPNPMNVYYDFPCPPGDKVFSVQKITDNLLTSNPRAYVNNDMGTGKTRTALWAWDYLNQEGYAGKLLVVAPLSSLNQAWAKECFAVLPYRRVAVLGSLKGMSKARRLQELSSEADIFVINHDGLQVIGDELQKRCDIDTLVLDELAVYRNKNNRSEYMRKFANRFKFVWGMTGSPMPEGPMDVWQQCRIITPYTVPKYKTHARDMLMVRVNDYVWEPKPDAIERALSWMQPAVRFTLDDVIELPEKVERFIDVPIGVRQKHVYKVLSTEACVAVGNNTITALNAGAAFSKLLQISGGWVYMGDKEVGSLDVDERLQILSTLVQSASKKVLVFAAFRPVVEGVYRFLLKQGIDCALVHGDVKDRDRIFSAFQNTTLFKCIVAHPKCMSHSLTLTAADTIIWYAPIPAYEIYEQANGRITRIGQKHRQQIIHLQSTPIERKVYRMLQRKEAVQDKFLELLAEATLSEED